MDCILKHRKYVVCFLEIHLGIHAAEEIRKTAAFSVPELSVFELSVSKEEGQSIIFPLKAGSRGGGEVGRSEGLASAVCLLARCPPCSLYVVKLQCLSSHPQQRDQTVFKYADQNPAG